MYQIDRTTNRLVKMKAVSFSELGFRERAHLQEWLASEPSALGEDLLIIQKEFDGFDDTRERLDLLALDRKGSLVVIENKLDDSGRDVVWQSLKYASYCSTLSKSEVAGIYQQYLNQEGVDRKAEELICEFLNEDDFDELSLNPGNGQRLFMVAGHFRKEVTSAVLWLLKHDVSIQCFKATPYRHDQSLFLNLEQIIPLPEASQMMIGMARKEKEEKATENRKARSHQRRLEFWPVALNALRENGVQLFANVNPTKDSWVAAGSGLSGVQYRMVFVQSEVRIEFALDCPDPEKNKAMFDHLAGKKKVIERRLGPRLEWRRMDGKRASLILSRKSISTVDREKWPEISSWMAQQMKKTEATFAPEIPQLRQLSL